MGSSPKLYYSETSKMQTILRPVQSVLIREVPLFQGLGIEELHCICIYIHMYFLISLLYIYRYIQCQDTLSTSLSWHAMCS